MLPKWKRPTGKFVLKVRRKEQWLRKACTWDNGEESNTEADTTPYINVAMGFPTRRRAEAMRLLLKEKYHLETQVMERKVVLLND